MTVFRVLGPLPACSAVRPPAACILSVKEQPGGEAYSLQTDLDSVWLNPASSCCFPPCCPDGRGSPTLSSPSPPPLLPSPPLHLYPPSFIHLRWLTRPINVLFVPGLRSFSLCVCVHSLLCPSCLSLFSAFLSRSPLSLCLAPNRMKIFDTLHWFLSASSSSVPTCISLFALCLPVVHSFLRRIETSVAHSHSLIWRHMYWLTQNSNLF